MSNKFDLSVEKNWLSLKKDLKKIVGDSAYNTVISSTKSMTGHLAAGAGGIEAVAAILAMENNCVPPTINYEYEDPDCDLDVTPNNSRDMNVDIVLSNSFGLGGQNSTVIFKRHEK